MKILLVSPYFKCFKRILPPIGLGYLATALEARGHVVDIIDFQVEYLPIPEASKRIAQGHYDAVGVSAITDNRFNAIELIRSVKKLAPGTFIFVGGPHFSTTSVDALTMIPEIDAVVREEGEVTTCELLEALKNKTPLVGIAGITFRAPDGKVIANQKRPFSFDPNLFPVAWHKFRMERYRYSFDSTGIPYVGVISSRGCVYNCAFCSNVTPKIHFRTPENFVNEIAFLKDTYGYPGFVFMDSTFTANHGHVEAICNLILKRDLRIRWTAGARVNSVNRPLLELMKKAGCIRIGYGVESGSEKVLKIINKGISIVQAREALQLTSDLGMESSAFFMVSFPDEGLKELKETIRTIKEFNGIKGCSAIYGFTLIYPGTQIERIAIERKRLPAGFSWNTYRIFPKYVLTDTSKTVPYYEEQVPIERTKLEIVLSNYPLSWRSAKAVVKKIYLYVVRSFQRTFLERT